MFVEKQSQFVNIQLHLEKEIFLNSRNGAFFYNMKIWLLPKWNSTSIRRFFFSNFRNSHFHCLKSYQRLFQTSATEIFFLKLTITNIALSFIRFRKKMKKHKHWNVHKKVIEWSKSRIVKSSWVKSYLRKLLFQVNSEFWFQYINGAIIRTKVFKTGQLYFIF